MVPLECLLSTNVLTFWDEFLKYVPLLIALIILLMFSAFFSCCETALSTSNIIRLKGFVEEKKRGAKKALYLAEKFDYLKEKYPNLTILQNKDYMTINNISSIYTAREELLKGNFGLERETLRVMVSPGSAVAEDTVIVGVPAAKAIVNIDSAINTVNIIAVIFFVIIILLNFNQVTQELLKRSSYAK